MANTPIGTITLRLTGTPIAGAALRLQDARRALVTCEPGGSSAPSASPPTTPADGSYLHTQASAQTTWTIDHGLGFQPSVRCYSVGGREMFAEVIHTGANQTRVYFDQPTAGYAVCS